MNPLSVRSSSPSPSPSPYSRLPKKPKQDSKYPALSKIIVPASGSKSYESVFDFYRSVSTEVKIPLPSGTAPNTPVALQQELVQMLKPFLGETKIQALISQTTNVPFKLLNDILKGDPATRYDDAGNIDYSTANVSRALTVFFDGLEAKLLDESMSKSSQTEKILRNIVSSDPATSISAFNTLFVEPLFTVKHVHYLNYKSSQFKSVPVDIEKFDTDQVTGFQEMPIRGDGNCFPRSVAKFLLQLSLEQSPSFSIQTFADDELKGLFREYQAQGADQSSTVERTMTYLKQKASERFDCSTNQELLRIIGQFTDLSSEESKDAFLAQLKQIVPTKTAELINRDILSGNNSNDATWTAEGKKELLEDGTWLSHQDLKSILSDLGVGLAIYSRPFRSAPYWQNHFDSSAHPFVVGLEYVSNAHYNLLKVHLKSGDTGYNLKPYLKLSQS